MSREIKFRCWLEDKKEMYYQDSNTASMMIGLERFVHLVGTAIGYTPEVMQFTGLKDKDGQDVYESDIIQYASGNPKIGGYKDVGGGDYIVFWDAHKWKLKRIGTGRWLQNINGIGNIQSQKKMWKVIGNIYENPELLNVSQGLT